MDYVKEDWTRFRTLGTLPSMAGVAPKNLKKLVVKELTDNALDIANQCRIGIGGFGSFWVDDEGCGIEGSIEEIATRFSINRPLMTSKLLRLPTRGALGNGLRVVCGYALATGGYLTVATKGRVFNLVPQHDGTTKAEFLGSCEEEGTRVEIHPGNGYKFVQKDLEWGLAAQEMSGYPTYNQASSPFWYDEDSFFELFDGYGGYARNVVASLEGCKGAKAGEITQEWKGRLANSLSKPETTKILRLARQASQEFTISRLKAIGPDLFGPSYGYAKILGSFVDDKGKEHLSVKSKIPFVLEAWVSVNGGTTDTIRFNVNRSPVTGEMSVTRGQKKKTECAIFGCELRNRFEVGLKNVDIIVNVQTPYMPISTQGKAPTFQPMLGELEEAIEKAANSGKTKHRRHNPAEKKREIIEIIRDVIDGAMAKASGDGANRFSLRQLFYQVRPYIIEELGKEPSYEWFGKCITIIENERGQDLPGIYRDDRGVIYHPHTGETISLGTMSVEEYGRPEWTFNKILYCEKEGFFQLLKDTKWPERHDCALITSKGTPTRAARDIIDFLGETDQELTFYCIHDADAAGTIIYQSLVEETLARSARKVEIIDLGLDPKEAIEMGLSVENMGKPEGGGERPVARDIDVETKEWLQTQRVELNAMTSPQFIAWLDSKMAEYNAKKLVPPFDVLTSQLEASTRAKIASIETSKVLATANIEGRVSEAMGRLNGQFEKAVSTLGRYVRNELEAEPAQSWTAPTDKVANKLAAKVAK